MSCSCCDGSAGVKLPVEAPEPPYAREKWPVYFVPSSSIPHWGTWYCPRCRKGLPVEIPVVVPEVRTFWQRLSGWLVGNSPLAT